MLDGKSREMGLGSLGLVSLSDARSRAQDARRLLQAGQDPIDVRDALRAEIRTAEAKSKLFSQCAADYLKAHRATWKNAKHEAQWESTLKTYCYPDPPAPGVWRDLPVSAIDSGLVLEVLEPIWKTKTETASRLRVSLLAV
jgi:hypothetical protein